MNFVRRGHERQDKGCHFVRIEVSLNESIDDGLRETIEDSSDLCQQKRESLPHSSLFSIEVQRPIWMGPAEATSMQLR